ncbi:heparan-alpha-glucosaminide N-acetyltransferase [Sporomusa aerivorans]|uniref:heparan-alpha-glucosaminide N-acetyltransferase n=1 Tax=Sporomusa aerivorans TaxID=204936 RepID=UPI00352AEE5F
MQAVRIDEIDVLRGIAVILMIIFHTVFDLAYFYNWQLDYLTGFWYYQGKASAVLFMLVSGISSHLSRNPVRRGFLVLGAGLLITAITYLASPAVYIRFGILHLLGVGMICTPLLARLSSLLLMLTGTLLLALNNVLAAFTVTTSVFIPVGLIPPEFSSLDYYPIIPWLGVVVYGMTAGRLLYRRKRPLWPQLSKQAGIQPLTWLGRRSLFLYLMHQPLILTVLYAIHKLFFPN